VIEYQRDLPADSSDDVIAAEIEHVRAHIAAIADADDDPATRAEDVQVWKAKHPDDPGLIRIEGRLDAEPDAPYLRPGFDPWANVDPELRKLVMGDG
jgi:hypothetical protein